MKRFVVGTVALLALGFIAASVHATPIVINNPSFEVPDQIGSPWWVDSPSGGSWNFATNSGVWMPLSPNPDYAKYFTATGQSQIIGDQVAWSNGGIISQAIIGYTLEANTQYTLSLLVGDRLDIKNANTTFSYGLYDLTTNTLLAGAMNVTETNAFGSDLALKGTFISVSSTFNSDLLDTRVGHALGIKLSASSVQYDFDNVVLTKESAGGGAVPLPAAAGLGFSMLGGFGAMFAFRKRMSRKSRIA